MIGQINHDLPVHLIIGQISDTFLKALFRSENFNRVFLILHSHKGMCIHHKAADILRTAL